MPSGPDGVSSAARPIWIRWRLGRAALKAVLRASHAGRIAGFPRWARCYSPILRSSLISLPWIIMEKCVDDVSAVTDGYKPG